MESKPQINQNYRERIERIQQKYLPILEKLKNRQEIDNLKQTKVEAIYHALKNQRLAPGCLKQLEAILEAMSKRFILSESGHLDDEKEVVKSVDVNSKKFEPTPVTDEGLINTTKKIIKKSRWDVVKPKDRPSGNNNQEQKLNDAQDDKRCSITNQPPVKSPPKINFTAANKIIELDLTNDEENSTSGNNNQEQELLDAQDDKRCSITNQPPLKSIPKINSTAANKIIELDLTNDEENSNLEKLSSVKDIHKINSHKTISLNETKVSEHKHNSTGMPNTPIIEKCKLDEDVEIVASVSRSNSNKGVTKEQSPFANLLEVNGSSLYHKVKSDKMMLNSRIASMKRGTVLDLIDKKGTSKINQSRKLKSSVSENLPKKKFKTHLSDANDEFTEKDLPPPRAVHSDDNHVKPDLISYKVYKDAQSALQFLQLNKPVDQPSCYRTNNGDTSSTRAETTQINLGLDQTNVLPPLPKQAQPPLPKEPPTPQPVPPPVPQPVPPPVPQPVPPPIPTGHQPLIPGETKGNLQSSCNLNLTNPGNNFYPYPYYYQNIYPYSNIGTLYQTVVPESNRNKNYTHLPTPLNSHTLPESSTFNPLVYNTISKDNCGNNQQSVKGLETNQCIFQTCQHQDLNKSHEKQVYNSLGNQALEQTNEVGLRLKDRFYKDPRIYSHQAGRDAQKCHLDNPRQAYHRFSPYSESHNNTLPHSYYPKQRLPTSRTNYERNCETYDNYRIRDHQNYRLRNIRPSYSRNCSDERVENNSKYINDNHNYITKNYHHGRCKNDSRNDYKREDSNLRNYKEGYISPLSNLYDTQNKSPQPIISTKQKAESKKKQIKLNENINKINDKGGLQISSHLEEEGITDSFENNSSNAPSQTKKSVDTDNPSKTRTENYIPDACDVNKTVEEELGFQESSSNNESASENRDISKDTVEKLKHLLNPNAIKTIVTNVILNSLKSGQESAKEPALKSLIENLLETDPNHVMPTDQTKPISNPPDDTNNKKNSFSERILENGASISQHLKSSSALDTDLVEIQSVSASERDLDTPNNISNQCNFTSNNSLNSDATSTVSKSPDILKNDINQLENVIHSDISCGEKTVENLNNSYQQKPTKQKTRGRELKKIQDDLNASPQFADIKTYSGLRSCRLKAQSEKCANENNKTVKRKQTQKKKNKAQSEECANENNKTIKRKQTQKKKNDISPNLLSNSEVTHVEEVSPFRPTDSKKSKTLHLPSGEILGQASVGTLTGLNSCINLGGASSSQYIVEEESYDDKCSVQIVDVFSVHDNHRCQNIDYEDIAKGLLSSFEDDLKESPLSTSANADTEDICERKDGSDVVSSYSPDIVKNELVEVTGPPLPDQDHQCMHRVWKSLTNYSEMLAEEKLMDFYKCMDHNCLFTHHDETAFTNHLTLHMSLDEFNKDPKTGWQLCAYCCKQLHDIPAYIAHLHSQHRDCSIQCRYCFHRASSQQQMMSHQEEEHKNQPRVSYVLQCPNSENLEDQH